MKFTLRAAWFLTVLSVLLCAALLWLRLQRRDMGTIAIGQDYLVALYWLQALCAVNLLVGISGQVRARRLEVRPLALTLVAALLPFFFALLLEAAGVRPR